ncbi:MFS transporter [Talaromyces proteolyticus]|uniref:MFS transporter n=1 Tax=Talaromyces proteolyticus TaxID=1131652 RepID=A0AAD4KPU2_9EURO|nr:MFS transporter [Talaromyces proteolyticus]KAH8696466.1 MFS transporter [Talaromyces proteolyticus]
MEKSEVMQAETLTNPGTADEAGLQKTVTVDTVHGDEATTVLANYHGDPTWDDDEEKRVKRKIDYRLLPILCATYGLQYYDKTMLSQAALFGLFKDLELETGNRFSFCASIFYLGFIVGAYPAIILAQRFPIERVASGTVLVWGICLTCTAACHNWQSFYAQRFFLGLLESGVSPMFMMVVGQFYKKDEQALRMGVWFSATGYISIVSPLINYSLGHITGSLSPWRYMYIVAGIITILWSAVILFFMPPDPIHGYNLNERERYIAVVRLRTNNSGVRNKHFKKEQLYELLIDLKFWLVFCITFLTLWANGPISTFIPTIIHGFGFSTLISLLLVMPSGAIIGTLQLVACYIAYKVPYSRSYLVVICELSTILSCLLLWLLPTHALGGLLFAAYILAANSAGYAVLMGMQLANTAGYTKRSLASSGIFVGYSLGNVVGPLLFTTTDAPRYPHGFTAVFASACAMVVLVIVYRFFCVWENKKRDKAGIMEGYEHAYDDDFTDRTNKQFRYIY